MKLGTKVDRDKMMFGHDKTDAHWHEEVADSDGAGLSIDEPPVMREDSRRDHIE